MAPEKPRENILKTHNINKRAIIKQDEKVKGKNYETKTVNVHCGA